MADPKPDEDRLIFAFAHDLRSYLRTILTRIQMVQADAAPLLPEQDRAFLEEAAGAAGDLNRLLSAMVSYFEVRSTPETTGLPLMLRGVLMEMKTIFAAADASVSVVNDLEDLVPKSLHPVLTEVLSNSCRFCRDDRKTEIHISTRRTGPETLEILVSDNGIGVEPEWLDKILLPFQRMHPRSRFPGFGLGLALCNRMIGANGGTISAQGSPSGGLAIVIRLPSVTK